MSENNDVFRDETMKELSCDKMIKRFLYDFKNKVLSPYEMITKRGVFTYEKNQFKYFIHWYNKTWTNCRAIELPIFFAYVKQYEHKRILEVGNVMSHYRKMNHDVLDKYEKEPGVINEDIVDFKPEKKYDVVLSCSTLEHVGFDEDEKDPFKSLRAIENIKENVLADDGILVFSVPIGYNPGLDSLLRKGLVFFDEVTYYKREKENDWFTCSWTDVEYSNGRDASRILIGVIRNE